MGLRNNVILNHKTPGGPDDYDGSPFDMRRRQSATTTNVSAKSYKDHEEAPNEGSSLFSSVMDKVQTVKMAQYAWDNRQYVAVSSGVVAAFYVANKTMDYLSAPPPATYSEISGRN